VESRYGRRLEFGLFPVPNAADLESLRAQTRRAEQLGLDLIGIQDHPYQWRYLDTWGLVADLIASSRALVEDALLRVRQLELRLGNGPDVVRLEGVQAPPEDPGR